MKDGTWCQLPLVSVVKVAPRPKIHLTLSLSKVRLLRLSSRGIIASNNRKLYRTRTLAKEACLD